MVFQTFVCLSLSRTDAMGGLVCSKGGESCRKKKSGCLLVIYRRLCRLSEWHYLCPRCFSKVVQTRKASRLSCRACRILISTGPSVVIIMHREFPFFFSATSCEGCIPPALTAHYQHLYDCRSFRQRFPKQRFASERARKGRSSRGERARGMGATGRSDPRSRR